MVEVSFLCACDEEWREELSTTRRVLPARWYLTDAPVRATCAACERQAAAQAACLAGLAGAPPVPIRFLWLPDQSEWRTAAFAEKFPEEFAKGHNNALIDGVAFYYTS